MSRKQISLGERLVMLIEKSLFRGEKTRRRVLRFLGNEPSSSDQDNSKQLRRFRAELLAPDSEENN